MKKERLTELHQEVEELIGILPMMASDDHTVAGSQILTALIIKESLDKTKNHTTEKKIIQIMPAEGWSAIFADEETWNCYPLAAFALVELADGTQEVRGMTSTYNNSITFCEDNKKFKQYTNLKVWNK